MSNPALPHLPPAVQPLRAVVWVLHLVLPVAGLWLLLAEPDLDVIWHDNGAHFWIVLVVAVVNVVLGLMMTVAARRRSDARLFLVSLVFLSSAGFLALHALATPGMLISHPNIGFDLAQPVGLALAAGFAVASSFPLDRPGAAARVLAWRVPLWTLLAVVSVGWATLSLLDLPPLNRVPHAREVHGPFLWMVGAAVLGYAVAAVRYYLEHRRRPAAMLLSVITAFTLLAEAMVAVALADKWHLSWWEWHILLTLAFSFVAYSAHVQYRREGSAAGLFDAITLAETARRISAEYSAALEELVGHLSEQERTGRSDGPVAARLAERFALTEGQVAVLDRAGAALAAERDLSRRLGALVAVGEQAQIGSGEATFLDAALQHARPAYGDIHIGLVSDGVVTVDGHEYRAAELTAPQVDGEHTIIPLTVKGRVAGALRAPTGAGTESALLTSLANQIAIALENTRLYRELGTLFRQYLSPDVAAALLADPDQAALGGSVVEVTALFADLRGFTTFSEGVEPGEIVTMLNRYHGVAVPAILDNGGTIVQFVGDALLALFNAPARQPDHAVRAVRAALRMQEAVDEIAAGRPDWPRFRVGANTGPALVGNIGSETLRGFNAMGDAVNVAARLQTLAEPGQVVIGESTMETAGDAVVVEPLGELTLKGKTQKVRAYVVTGLAG